MRTRRASSFQSSFLASTRGAKDPLLFGLVRNAAAHEVRNRRLQRTPGCQRLQFPAAYRAPDFVVDRQPFHRRHAALVTCMQAGGATRPSALVANAPNQALV